MKTLKLNTKERMLAIQVLNLQGRGSLNRIRKVFKILDLLDFTDEERQELQFQTSGDKILWNPDKDIEKEIQFEDSQFEIFSDIILGYENWNVDRDVIRFCDKVEELL